MSVGQVIESAAGLPASIPIVIHIAGTKQYLQIVGYVREQKVLILEAAIDGEEEKG